MLKKSARLPPASATPQVRASSGESPRSPSAHLDALIPLLLPASTAGHLASASWIDWPRAPWSPQPPA